MKIGAAPAVGAPGALASGTGTLTPGGACDCQCLCGAGSFPNVNAAQGAVGAIPNMASMGNPTTLTTAVIVSQPGGGPAAQAGSPSSAQVPPLSAGAAGPSKALTTDVLVSQPGGTPAGK